MNIQTVNSVGQIDAHTIAYDVSGVAQAEYRFSVTSFGNGTFTVQFIGPVPVKIVAPGSASLSYVAGAENVVYTASHTLSPLIIFYSASPAPFIDGSVSHSCPGSTCSASLAISQPNDILLAYGATGQNGGLSASISDSAGSSWTTRNNNVSIGASQYKMEEYWTLINGPIVDNVTFTGFGFFTSLIVFAVSGTLNGFDGGTVIFPQSGASAPGASFSVRATGDFIVSVAFDSDQISVGSCCSAIETTSPLIYGASEFYPTIQTTGQTVRMTFASPGEDTIMIDGLASLKVSEPKAVLFRDDFLYTSPYLESSWIVDQYFVPGTPSGEYTSSGYLVMTNKLNPGALTEMAVHPNIAMWSPSGIVDGTIIKRKMTVAMIPFAVNATNVANIHVGLTHLITAANPYPQTGFNPPFGTPNTNQNGYVCADSAIAADNVGIEYMSMNVDGVTVGVSCGYPSGTTTVGSFPTVYDPTRYTVFTIQTSGVYCSTCAIGAFPGTSWVSYRVYQEDLSGKIVAGTDNLINQTSGVAPLYGIASTYAFISVNTNGVATTKSSIDFISVQSYGSPVCLTAPSGALCTRLPPVPGSLGPGSTIVDYFAYIAFLIGSGDEQLGAIILFVLLSVPIAGAPFYFTNSIPVATLSELSLLGFFIYVGFLPVWVLLLIMIPAGVIVVMMINRLMGGHSLGGGGSSQGDVG